MKRGCVIVSVSHGASRLSLEILEVGNTMNRGDKGEMTLFSKASRLLDKIG